MKNLGVFLLACAVAVAGNAASVFVQDREVFVHEANYDTEGEYLSVKAASPVWTFLGKGGMPDVAWPSDYDTSAIGRHLGYVRRAGSHGISAYDWTWLMNFAEGVFGIR